MKWNPHKRHVKVARLSHCDVHVRLLMRYGARGRVESGDQRQVGRIARLGERAQCQEGVLSGAEEEDLQTGSRRASGGVIAIIFGARRCRLIENGGLLDAASLILHVRMVIRAVSAARATALAPLLVCKLRENLITSLWVLVHSLPSSTRNAVAHNEIVGAVF
eukprot:CAMPEP_0185794428 /NCGR_PEP_ID=MMETSP1174-20130828/160011_1 /TAXON_ID=35687 /ORGANISM="Dictyocha speculum, Strain CCMP1381" /LENGTH=162 /DNA_ID=CAMNT_0028489659 /DNA_START=747 /DNA_END=1235 /DNA_ORIENTATION=-